MGKRDENTDILHQILERLERVETNQKAILSKLSNGGGRPRREHAPSGGGAWVVPDHQLTSGNAGGQPTTAYQSRVTNAFEAIAQLDGWSMLSNSGSGHNNHGVRLEGPKGEVVSGRGLSFDEAVYDAIKKVSTKPQ